MEGQKVRGKVFGLDGLVKEYDYVLFGSDAILKPAGFYEWDLEIEEKKELFQNLSKKARSRRVYLSRLGANEIVESNKLKPRIRFYSMNPNVVSNFNESNRLLEVQDFRDNYRKEIYNQVKFLYEIKGGNFSFSKEEKDLMFLGVALSKRKAHENNSVSVVSNNLDMVYAFNGIRPYLDKSLNVDFYKRLPDNSFEMLSE